MKLLNCAVALALAGALSFGGAAAIPCVAGGCELDGGQPWLAKGAVKRTQYARGGDPGAADVRVSPFLDIAASARGQVPGPPRLRPSALPDEDLALAQAPLPSALALLASGLAGLLFAASSIRRDL